jgi:hypothetical protein
MRIRIRILLLIKVMIISQIIQTLQGSIRSLHASIMSVNGHPLIHFEPVKL